MVKLAEALASDRIYNKKPANPLKRKDFGIGELSGNLAILAVVMLHSISNENWCKNLINNDFYNEKPTYIPKNNLDPDPSSRGKGKADVLAYRTGCVVLKYRFSARRAHQVEPVARAVLPEVWKNARFRP